MKRKFILNVFLKKETINRYVFESKSFIYNLMERFLDNSLFLCDNGFDGQMSANIEPSVLIGIVSGIEINNVSGIFKLEIKCISGCEEKFKQIVYVSCVVEAHPDKSTGKYIVTDFKYLFPIFKDDEDEIKFVIDNIKG